jgi:hypothetical protein
VLCGTGLVVGSDLKVVLLSLGKSDVLLDSVYVYSELVGIEFIDDEKDVVAESSVTLESDDELDELSPVVVGDRSGVLDNVMGDVNVSEL